MSLQEGMTRGEDRMTQDSIPAVLDAAREKNAFLARIKKRIAKHFRWTRSASLLDVAELAFLLDAIGRDDDARKTSRSLGQYEFAGNHSLWSGVERALGLAARLY